MQQTTTANGMRKLTAADGHRIVYLGDLSTATTTAYLGQGDSPDNYTEVTEAEVEAWEQEQHRLAQEAEGQAANGGTATREGAE